MSDRPPPPPPELPGIVAVQPEPTPVRPLVLWIASAGAASSGAALVVAIVTDRPLWLTAGFILVPGFIALVALTVMARRDQQTLFLERLRWGVIGGLAGTVAYDISRWFVETMGWSSTNSFRAMPVFGQGLTDQPTDDPVAIAAGWVFHFVNGIGFAVAYTMVAAGRHWLWGVVWGLALEAFMIALYPDWLGVTLSREFLSVSIMGHVFYGVGVGLAAQRSP